MRVQTAALMVLQHATKAYFIQMFKEPNSHVTHTEHVTIMPKDIKLAKKKTGVKSCQKHSYALNLRAFPL